MRHFRPETSESIWNRPDDSVCRALQFHRFIRFGMWVVWCGVEKPVHPPKRTGLHGAGSDGHCRNGFAKVKDNMLKYKLFVKFFKVFFRRKKLQAVLLLYINIIIPFCGAAKKTADFFLGCGLFAYRINNVRNLRLVKTAFLLERAPCGTCPRSLRGPAGEFAGRSRWKTGTVLYFFCTFAI